MHIADCTMVIANWLRFQLDRPLCNWHSQLSHWLDRRSRPSTLIELAVQAWVLQNCIKCTFEIRLSASDGEIICWHLLRVGPLHVSPMVICLSSSLLDHNFYCSASDATNRDGSNSKNPMRLMGNAGWHLAAGIWSLNNSDPPLRKRQRYEMRQCWCVCVWSS